MRDVRGNLAGVVQQREQAAPGETAGPIASSAATTASPAASPVIMRVSCAGVAPMLLSSAISADRCRTDSVNVEVTAKTTRSSPQPPTTLAIVTSVSWAEPLVPDAVSSIDANPIRIVAPRNSARKLAVNAPARLRRERSASAVIVRPPR